MRQYYIDSNEVLVAPGWSLFDKINARSTVKFKVVHGVVTINNGDEFKVMDGTSTIFKGVIKNIIVMEPSPGYLEYNISVVDNSAKADKLTIAESWYNEKSGDVVKDIVARLSGEGVTIGTIQDGPTLTKVISPYYTCAKLLDEIKNLTGYVWNIDSDDKLNFYERSTYSAPWDLTNDVQHVNFKHNKNMDQYTNTFYTRGGLGLTAIQPDEQPSPAIPDGATRTFTLRYPVAEKPVIEVNLNSAGWTTIASSDIGVNGLDENKKWYFSYNSQTITQDSTEVALAKVDLIRVTYTGLRRIFVKVDDPVEISNRKTIEVGTSGVYEKLVYNDNITSSEQGIEYTQGLLEVYGQIADTVTYQTNVSGLEAGMLQRINKPLYGILGDFLIESVKIMPDGSDLKYDVKCLDGASIGGWESFFKDLVDSGKDFVIGENEVIILLQTQTETNMHEGQLIIDIFEPPECDVGLKVGTFKVGGLLLNEVTLDD